jgi:hypothetical protein
MYRNSLCWLLSLFTIVAFSCKKTKNPDLPDTAPVTVYDNYTALKPGNYWIYENFKLDSVNGAANTVGTYDSFYVDTDTMMNGHIYHRYRVPVGIPVQYGVNYIRDSLSYVVNYYGLIMFSSTDFSTTFRSYTYGPNASTPDTLMVTEKMDLKDATTVVPAGTFTTCAFRRIFAFPVTYTLGRTRSYDYKYAKGIGLISETTGFYADRPEMYERRLIRYHVQ